MNGRALGLISVAVLLNVPAVVLRLGGIHLGVVADTVLFGLAIVSSAFILSWVAEAAQIEISASLAIAFVALIAVLPEYAVDMTFAWKAGTDPEFAPFAVANMTGGNRLLIGAAWPMIFFLFWWKTRSHVLRLEPGHSVEVLALALATIYSFTLPLKGSIELYDTVILGAIFIGYVLVIAKAPIEEPELVGPAQAIGELPRSRRRGVIAGLFLIAAGAIIAAAEPFAEGLIHTGTDLGIDEFLLVQWVAPFASEAPEFLVAGILAWRGRASVGMGTLLSSKVNQWTLLIGGLPIAFVLSSGGWSGLPMDARQQEEVFLTAAQSAFAVAILVSLSLNRWEAGLLFVLFAVQFAVPNQEVRIGIAIAYLVLAAWILFRGRHELPRLWGAARDAARGGGHGSVEAGRPVPEPGGQ